LEDGFSSVANNARGKRGLSEKGGAGFWGVGEWQIARAQIQNPHPSKTEGCGIRKSKDSLTRMLESLRSEIGRAEAFLPHLIKSATTPRPQFWVRHEGALHWICGISLSSVNGVEKK
jgi:hypothetical protein